MPMAIPTWPGWFSFSATFAPLPALTSTDFYDGYVVKYDDQGQALWALTLTGSGVDVCRDLSMDAAGNVYVTGDFSSPTLTIGSITLTGNGYENIFVAKIHHRRPARVGAQLLRYHRPVRIRPFHRHQPAGRELRDRSLSRHPGAG